MKSHNSSICRKPFCDECWQIIKGNLQGIMKVADELSKPNEVHTDED